MRRKILIPVLMAIGMVLAVALPIQAQQPDNPPTVLKSYPVMDLLASDFVPQYYPIQWPGTGMFPGSSATAKAVPSYGGGGGMGAGGGGLFAVPQGGMSMGGQGGMGGSVMMQPSDVPGSGTNGSFGGATRSHTSYETFDMSNDAQQLMSILESMVEPTSWATMGSGEGAAAFYGGSLLVRQTEANHGKVEEVLKLLRSARASQQVVQLEWVAVRGTSAPLPEMASWSAQQQANFIDQNWVQRGGVSTLNGRLAYTTAAEHRNLVISITPVVGSGGNQFTNQDSGNRVGYQPTTVKPALGWVVQLRPMVEPDAQNARIQVGACYTQGPPEMEKPAPGQVDRGDLKSFQVGAVVEAAAGQWALAGGLASAEESMGAEQQGLDGCHYYVFVRWHVGKAEPIETEE